MAVMARLNAKGVFVTIGACAGVFHLVRFELLVVRACRKKIATNALLHKHLHSIWRQGRTFNCIISRAQEVFS